MSTLAHTQMLTDVTIFPVRLVRADAAGGPVKETSLPPGSAA